MAPKRGVRRGTGGKNRKKATATECYNMMKDTCDRSWISMRSILFSLAGHGVFLGDTRKDLMRLCRDIDESMGQLNLRRCPDLHAIAGALANQYVAQLFDVIERGRMQHLWQPLADAFTRHAVYVRSLKGLTNAERRNFDALVFSIRHTAKMIDVDTTSGGLQGLISAIGGSVGINGNTFNDLIASGKDVDRLMEIKRHTKDVVDILKLMEQMGDVKLMCYDFKGQLLRGLPAMLCWNATVHDYNS